MDAYRTALLTYWAFIWLFHSFLIFGNLASFVVAPFNGPWYLAFPACFAIIWVTCSPADCAITNWENTVREKLGWPRIRGFIGHYYVKPVRRLYRKCIANCNGAAGIGEPTALEVQAPKGVSCSNHDRSA